MDVSRHRHKSGELELLGSPLLGHHLHGRQLHHRLLLGQGGGAGCGFGGGVGRDG